MAQKFTRVVMHSNNIDSCNRTWHAPSVAGLATVFGAGGGTSSYQEAEETNVIFLWGSNARETYPFFFHHVLRGVRNGARLIAVDPRKTSSAEWADVWLGIDVGTDNVLALINLGLLTGKVGRYGCGLNPLRGQNNVQGGGDMGAIPARVPGFQDLEIQAIHDKFASAWGGAQFPSKKGWHLSEMFE